MTIGILLFIIFMIVIFILGCIGEMYEKMSIDERWEEELKFRNKHFAKILRDELLLNVESGCIYSSYYGKNGKL